MSVFSNVIKTPSSKIWKDLQEIKISPVIYESKTKPSKFNSYFSWKVNINSIFIWVVKCLKLRRQDWQPKWWDLPEKDKMHTINQLQLSQYKNFTPKHKYNRIKFQNSEFLFSSIFIFYMIIQRYDDVIITDIETSKSYTDIKFNRVSTSFSHWFILRILRQF